MKSGPIKIAPRKTIFVHPGEAIMLTSKELKPKNLSQATDTIKNLIYFLVSGNLKYGDLKLKKVISYDEDIPIGWSIVNDIYLEKKVTEFTQHDLDSGNVWYEPFSDMNINSGNTDNQQNIECQFSENNAHGIDCDPILRFSSIQQGSKYDHCMFEVTMSFNFENLFLSSNFLSCFLDI